MNKFFTFIVILFIVIVSNAQTAGDIDLTFNPGDVGFGFGDGPNDNIMDLAIQEDGKIIICGDFTTYNNFNSKYLARLNNDGSLDQTFNIGIGTNYFISNVKIQNDGKILIAGSFYSYNGNISKSIARLNADGSFDTSFSVGTSLSSSIATLSLQDDGKIIIGGQFTNYNGIPMNQLGRLNADGSMDPTFDVGTGPSSNVFISCLQNDGKLLISGYFESINGTSSMRLARLNNDGSVDPTFQIGSGINYGVLNDIEVQADGKIIIAGDFDIYDGDSVRFIARLNSDGTLDLSFDVGTGPINVLSSITLQDDGMIVITGGLIETNGVVKPGFARLNSDGSLDLSFNQSLLSGSCSNAEVQENGQLIIICSSYLFEVYRPGIARVNADGTNDESFIVNTGSNNLIITTSIQEDGQIVIGGNFTSFNNVMSNRVARLNVDGTVDTTFSVGVGANSTVFVSEIQNDGKILIGGDFMYFNGITSRNIVRLNQDGSVDTTFNIGVGFNGAIYSIKELNDGKIIAAGEYTMFNGNNINRIVRLNPDGSLDGTFNAGSIANYPIRSVIDLSNGQLLIGGAFNYFNGSQVKGLARLNPDGSLDPTFSVGTGPNGSISTCFEQNDGKIIAGGYFTLFNGTAFNNLVRINTDGSLDNTFNTSVGPNQSVNTVLEQEDGLLIIGGNFTQYDGKDVNFIARLKNDGSLDENFISEAGFNNIILSSALQKDGKLILCGGFTAYNGVGRNRIARIESETVFKASTHLIYPNPTNGEFSIELDTLSTIHLFNLAGEMIYAGSLEKGKHTLNIEKHANGLYFVKVEQYDSEYILKLIKCEP